jgi:general secretion pathway protein J
LKKNVVNADGFTLVEVLLSLSLTTVLLSLLSGGMFIASGEWSRSSENLELRIDRNLSLLQFERALQGAFPHSYANSESLAREIFFSGESDSISWVSTVSPQREPGLTAWRLYNEPSLGIMLQLAPAFSDNPQLRLNEAEPSLVLPNYRLQVRYLTTAGERQMEWSPVWSGPELMSLPSAVYLEFIPENFRANRGRAELLASLRSATHRSLQPIRPNIGLQL